jgi:hypothetical protein
MNLNFEIQNSTHLEPGIVIDKILLKLKNKNYGVLGFTDKSVVFNSHSSGLVWRSERFSRLESGKFEIISYEDYYIVRFEYRPLALSEIIFVPIIAVVFSVFGIINGTYFGILIGSVFVLQMILKFFNLKRIAKEMLNDILTS